MGEQAEWLARRSRMKPTPEWDKRPRLATGSEPYWRAFQELSAARTGPGVAIAASDVRAWCDLMGVDDRLRRGTYFRIIRRVDDALLGRQRDAMTAAVAQAGKK